MKRDRVVEFLEAMGATKVSTGARTGWVVSRCPLGPWNHDGGASAPGKFGVRIEEGDPRANCFVCEWHGTLGSLIQHMKGLQVIEPRDVALNFKQALRLVEEAEETADYDFDDLPDIEATLAAGTQLHEFPQSWLDTFPAAWSVPFARRYLFKRGVPQWLSTMLDLRADPVQGRVCFPVRAFNKKLYGLHGRAVEPGVEPRYRMYQHDKRTNPSIWLGEAWVDTEKPIVVVEGPFDLAAVRRVYPNVVSPLNASPNAEKLKRMADADEWFTLFDHGTGGDKGRARIEDVMGENHVVRHLYPPGHRKDPGDMTKLELIDLLSPFVQLTTK